MSANLRIIASNDADAATLTASPAAVATLPVGNLQDQTRARVWRSTSTAAQAIMGTWADSRSVSAFALVRHNLSSNATMRFRLWDAPGQTGNVLYDSGATLRTNLCPHSQTLAAWASNALTVVDNAATDPNATSTADSLTETTANAIHYTQQAPITVVSGANFTYSMHLKASTGNGFVQLPFDDGTSNGFYINVNLNTGAISGSGTYGTGAYVGSTITALPNGWYRVTATGNIPGTSARALIVMSNSAGAGLFPSYAGSVGNSVLAWGAQAELGTAATGYIATTTAAASVTAYTLTIGSMIGWGSMVWGIDPWGGSNIFAGWAYAWTEIWFSAVQARSFQIDIIDSANPAGYMQASRLFIGQYFEPVKNMDYGLTLSWEESSTQRRTDGGTLRTDNFDPFRRWTFQLSNLSEAERSQLMDIIRKIGMRQDFFMSCFPDVGGTTQRDYAGQCKIVQMPSFTKPSISLFQAPFVIEES